MISSLFNIQPVFLWVRQGPLRLLRDHTLKLFRTIAVLTLMGLLAVSVRADNGPGGGGPGPTAGGGGGGSDDGNHSGPPGPTAVGGTHRGAPGGPSGKEYRSGRSADGAYTVNISGYFTGTGTASVSASTVTISGTVNFDGGTVSFQSEALNLSGPYFEGNATAGNSKLLIKGKLDATKQSRLTATYSTVGDNHHGRIAGTLPTDTPVDNWDDNGHH
jgi:hypothetical protein